MNFPGAILPALLTVGAKIQGGGNLTASNIVKTDIVSTNGLIYVIDGVSLP